ncbi:MAG: ABC transporter substrate-binding protein, partial [Acidimicrobiales bacterium]
FVSLGVVMAACGGDDDDDDGGGGGDTTTTEAAGDFEGLSFDESAACGTDEYPGNIATLEAVDELTVTFTLCDPDVAFPAKVAFSAFGIHPSEYIESTGGGGDLVDSPIGTGPYKLEEWDRGNQLVLTANEDYWGDPAPMETVVFRWSTEAAQRLVELQSGQVDGIDQVGPEDFATVEGDDSLQLIPRDPLNVFYLGFNVDRAPFDNETLRQAIGYAINKDRIVDNFYPSAGTDAATQFLPAQIPGNDPDFEGFAYDQQQARDLLAQAGFPDGLDLGVLSYRNVFRPYLPQPPQVASDIRDQLAQVGLTVQLDEQESGAFIDNANVGNLSMYMLGWGADYPDATNFMDFHFGATASPQFGTGFTDIHDVLDEAASLTDPVERNDLYAQANELLLEHAPMIPIAYGGSGVAFKAEVEGAHASPLSNESFAAMSIEGQDQLVWMQNAEPLGLYCADETDGESLRACEQINESLLAYEVGGTETVPALAEDFESNEDLTEWTFTLREGVTFHDGSALDANDVVLSYRMQWDASDPLHVGREALFTYFDAFFGFVNPPPAEPGG